MFATLDEIQCGLREVYGTQNRFTIALTGTGMAAMESCFANLIEPGDTALIGVHGFFGGRMAEMAARYGANVVRVDAEWGSPLDPQKLAESAESAGRIKLVACVHAETSTGTRQPLEPIAEIARKHDALFLVDAVTSLGGLPVEVDRIGIDAAYSASQKCMGNPPGLSPVTVSERAMAAVTARKTPVQVWYYDWTAIGKYWGEEHGYHHTVPSNNLAGLREGLRIISEEGLESRWERHRTISDRLMAGLAEMGIYAFAQEGFRLPTLNAVKIPNGVDDASVRGRLLEEYGIEIGGGFGPLRGKIWRIGTMGDSATPRNVDLLLGTLGRVLAAS